MTRSSKNQPRNANSKNKASGNRNASRKGKVVKHRAQKITSRSQGVPIARNSSNSRSTKAGRYILSGSDYLGKVTTKANPATAKDQILGAYKVSPSALPGTRLNSLSNLWERYRFLSYRLRYVPSVPTTLACQYMTYVDTDPQDDPSTILDATALLRQATAQEGSQQWNFHQMHITQLVQRGDDQLYYTGPTKENTRLSLQGIAYLLQVTRPDRKSVV